MTFFRVEHKISDNELRAFYYMSMDRIKHFAKESEFFTPSHIMKYEREAGWGIMFPSRSDCLTVYRGYKSRERPWSLSNHVMALDAFEHFNGYKPFPRSIPHVPHKYRCEIRDRAWERNDKYRREHG